VFCQLGQKTDAMAALSKAWAAGWKDVEWTRRDPDLSILHGEAEFERLYPDKAS
jgi:non-specific serine/threonine protein kinase